MADKVLRIGMAALLLLAAPTAFAKNQPSVAEGAHYVAMGSSFAAGPGITQSADTPPTRCNRSTDNYAHQLARRYKLRLTDVSCGGATTAHITGPWTELPPQVDALQADTALVTVTIGGNDVGYIGKLMAASCAGGVAASPAVTTMCKAMAARRPATGAAMPDDAWGLVANGLDRIAQEVRLRSPKARLIFVDYLSIVPARGGCGSVPLSKEAARDARKRAKRLARETAAAAKRAGAEIVRASQLSKKHDACAPTPWMTGLLPEEGQTGFVPYHPNLAGMTAVSRALDRRLAN